MQSNSPLNKIIGRKSLLIPREDSYWPLSDQYIGLEMELEGYSAAQHKQHVKEGGERIWAVHTDGSLRNGIELVLAQPMMGQALRSAIDYFYNTFTKFTASPRTSIHVHMNMCQDNDTMEVLTNMVVLYYMYEDAFFKVADESRKWCSYANPFEDTPPQILLDVLKINAGEGLKQNLVDSAQQNTNRYYGLNLIALEKFGTLEFRHLPLVYDKQKLIDWISLLMELKLAAVQLAQQGNTPYSVFTSPMEMGKLSGLMPRFADTLRNFVPDSLALLRMQKLQALLLPVVKTHFTLGENKAWANFKEAVKDKIKPVPEGKAKMKAPVGRGRNQPIPPPRARAGVRLNAEWAAPPPGWGVPEVDPVWVDLQATQTAPPARDINMDLFNQVTATIARQDREQALNREMEDLAARLRATAPRTNRNED